MSLVEGKKFTFSVSHPHCFTLHFTLSNSYETEIWMKHIENAIKWITTIEENEKIQKSVEKSKSEKSKPLSYFDELLAAQGDETNTTLDDDDSSQNDVSVFDDLIGEARASLVVPEASLVHKELDELFISEKRKLMGLDKKK